MKKNAIIGVIVLIVIAGAAVLAYDANKKKNEPPASIEY